MSDTMAVFKEHRCWRCQYYGHDRKCECKDSPYYAHECDSNFWSDHYKRADELELKRREKEME